MTKLEYFFYEWLIIEKHMDENTFDALTPEELRNLRIEFIHFYSKLNK